MGRKRDDTPFDQDFLLASIDETTTARSALPCSPIVRLTKLRLLMSHQSMSITSVQVDGRLRVFADPLRSRIVSLLAAEQLCTCHLVEETGAKQSTVSHHLKALREAGLVDASPCGRFTYYRLVPEAVEALADHLADLAAAARTASDRRRPC